jgi:hypothetical protein
MGRAGRGGSAKGGGGGGCGTNCGAGGAAAGTNCGAGGAGGTGGGDAANGVLGAGVVIGCVALDVDGWENGGGAAACTTTKLSSDPVDGLSRPVVMSIDDEPLALKFFPLGDCVLRLRP